MKALRRTIRNSTFSSAHCIEMLDDFPELGRSEVRFHVIEHSRLHHHLAVVSRHSRMVVRWVQRMARRQSWVKLNIAVVATNNSILIGAGFK